MAVTAQIRSLSLPSSCWQHSASLLLEPGFPTSAQPAQPARASRAPATFFTHTDTVEAAQIDTRADMRLDAHLSAPPAIPIPEEDDDLHEAPPDIEMPLSTAVEDAFAHLERAIDNMHAEHL